MNNPAILLLLGVCVGIYSGVMGLGGGTLMIPAMVLLLGFRQDKANATSLAVMLPPVMLPAIIRFYHENKIEVSVAVWIALGVVGGSWVGAYIAGQLNDRALKLIFGFVLMYIAAYTVFNTLGSDHLVRSMILAAMVAIIGAGVFWTLRV